MRIDNEFTVSVPVEEAWKVLTDLEGIAPCLPGARLTGVAGDVYSGRVKIKVGPVVSEYAGTARFVEKDDAAHRAVIDAKGKDSRGTGNAAATINASLRPDGEHTVVTVNTDLAISGKIAQFGSGMIKEVSGKLLGQFVQNLEAKLQTSPPSPDLTPDLTPDVNPAPPAETPVQPVAPQPATARVLAEQDPDPQPLDLMSLAGGSVYKRAIPLAAGAVVVAAVIVYAVTR